MVKKSGLARQIAELIESAPKDFDPEENGVVDSSDDGDNSQDSDDDLVGTEHYVKVGSSKLRKREEIALGPKYAGSRISRKALQDSGDETPSSDYEDARESQEIGMFADPDASDMEVDEDDGEIDSDEAFGESDREKFKEFKFRGSSTASKQNGFHRGRRTAADFMGVSGNEHLDTEPGQNADINEDEEQLNGEFGGFDEVEEEDSGNDTEEEEEDDDDDGGQDDGPKNGTEYSDLESNLDEDKGGAEDEDEKGDEDEGSSDSNDDINATTNNDSQRAEIRRIMNEEQKSVVATFSQAARADAQKGKAVKKQRKTFDSLLNIRIRLQKALVSSNSMSATDDISNINTFPYQAAEEAAIKLLGTLDTLRQALAKTDSSTISGEKRKRSIQLNMSSSAIWEHIQNLESDAVNKRQSILEKWSARVRDTTAHPISRRLNTTTQQTITDVLKDQLSNSERLVKRTKMPRSCAPVQVKMKVTEDPDIYDDADFYQLLLKELVDQRMTDSTSISAPLDESGRPIAQWMAVKEAKTKKNVDTKASKGRKMRYTVHEKLQNFMAPEGRGTWEQDAIDRFFGTLLGQNMTLGEEDGGVSDGEEAEAPLVEEALILFRS